MRNALAVLGPVVALSLGLVLPPPRAEVTDVPPLEGSAAVLWHSDYAAPPPGAYPQAVAVSPSGDAVFVAGAAFDRGWLREDYLTLAFAADSGELRWAATCGRAGDRFVQAMVPSPDGEAIYVTGTSRNPTPEIETVAFAARSGHQLWSAREGREAGGVAADPGGRRVFVTGSGTRTAGLGALYVAARNAESGALLWHSHTRLLDNSGGFDVIPSLDGNSIYVLAAAANRSGTKIAEIERYDAASGEVEWTARLGEPGQDFRIGAMVLTRDGETLFAAGHLAGPGGGVSVVGALSAASGSVLWTRSRTGRQAPCALAVSPDGSDLFLGDCDSSSETGLEALNAVTGDPLWRAEQIETRGVSRIAVSSMGDRVAVLAERRTSVAVLDARSGASIWSARYTDEARAADLAFDRSGRTLFVPSRVEDGVGTRVRLTAFRESDGSGEAASARTAP